MPSFLLLIVMEFLVPSAHPVTWFPQKTRSKWADIPRIRMNPMESGILKQLRDIPTFRAAAEETVARVFGDRFDIELTFNPEPDVEQFDLERLKDRYEKGHDMKGKVTTKELKSLIDENQKAISEKEHRTGKKRKRDSGMKLKDHYVNTIIKRYWVPFLREMFIYIKMWGFCPYRLKAVEYRGEIHYYPKIPPLDSGFVEVYQTKDRELELLWNWNEVAQTFKHHRNMDQTIDENVRFIIKDMPSMYGKYNSDLMSLAKDYLNLDITEDLQTQSNLQKAYPTHIVEYHESGKSTTMGDVESQWYQNFSRNDLNLQFEKYKRDKYYEDTGFQSSQFFFAHDQKNVKNAAQLTGFGNYGTEGYVTPSRLQTLQRIQKTTQRRLDISSTTAGSPHPAVENSFTTKRLDENEKFVNVNFPQVGDPDYQKKKDRFDRLVSIMADNSLFMSLVTEKPKGGKGGFGGISKDASSIEETKLHFASRYKSIVEFYSEKIKEVWADAYSRMFEIELKKGKQMFKREYTRVWGKKASKEEVDIFTSLLNIEVNFPKASFLSVSELKEMWHLGLMSEEDFYKHAVMVTGIEDRGQEGIARASKRLKELKELENPPEPDKKEKTVQNKERPVENKQEKK